MSGADPERTPTEPPRRKRVLRSLLIVGSLLALAWTVRSLGPRQVWQVTARADGLWLALSALPILARFLVWSLKWQRMLARRRPVPLATCLRVLLAGSFVNLTTPTAKLAGGFVRAGLLHRRRDWRLDEAYGWAMADQVTNVLGHLAFFALMAVSAVFVLPAGWLRQALLTSGLLVLGGLVVGAGLRPWAFRVLTGEGLGRRIGRMMPGRLRVRLERVGLADSARTVLRPLLVEGTTLTTFLPDVLWATVAFACLSGANALVLRSLGADVPFVLVGLAVSGGYFAGVAAGAGGGLGVTEAVLTGLYVQFDVPTEVAAAGALLHRALFYAAVLGLGGWSLAWESRAARS